MNCDPSLTFLDRYDLKISGAALKKEFGNSKFQMNAFELIKKSGCASKMKKNLTQRISIGNSASKSTPSTIGDEGIHFETTSSSCCESSLCHDSMLFDTLKCALCI